jgi:nucleoside-diphosphate-sugar epimerase
MTHHPTTERELDIMLAEPSPALVGDMARLEGDVIILGAGGKMGPTLSLLARNALNAAGHTDARVIAVSRWSDPKLAEQMVSNGVETLRADLSPDSDLSQLPDAQNLVYMVGAKFGSGSNPSAAWITNCVLPSALARRYSASNFTAFSTGNVYPFTPVSDLGSTESSPVAPVGEYAMSCLGRERVIQAASQTDGLRAAIIRLNYAVEPRYGVLCDIAQKILAGTPVDLSVGYVNIVGQRYANEVVLRSLLLVDNPPRVINLTGPEILSVRATALRLGELLNKEVVFAGEESGTALLSNATECHGLFGYPDVSAQSLIEMQAEWMLAGGRLLGKPTKFERQDGKF